MYYIYHIPGVKIGVTTNLKDRVERQQGYEPGEYQLLMSTEDIDFISEQEIKLQKLHGYRVDRQLYKDLHNNNFKQLNNMNINVTEMTTTFPCPVNKLKGRLLDEIGMQWETEFGPCGLTTMSIEWIIQNVKTSQYTQDRCYIYNKAFARWTNIKMQFKNTHKEDGILRVWVDDTLAYEYLGPTSWKGDRDKCTFKLGLYTNANLKSVNKEGRENMVVLIDAMAIGKNEEELLKNLNKDK